MRDAAMQQIHGGLMKNEVARESSAPDARPSSFVSLLSGWVQQGMESFFATQRILLDVAMRQNASVMKSLRENLSDPQSSPVTLLSELAVEGTSNFIEAQRVLLDLAQRENEIVMGGIKERVVGSVPAVAFTDLVRRSIDTFVEMQQDFLTIAGKQSQGWLEAAKAGKPYDRSYMIDLAKDGMENFVRAQKKFLDVIAEETEKATGNKPLHLPKDMKKTELTKLAGQAASAFVDAQKKLLDVASQQVKVNLQVVGRASEMFTPFRVPLASLTGEGVKSFVDAEKALIDSMMKKDEPKRKGRATGRTAKKRVVRKRKVIAAVAV
jgi:hypothetical protein